MLRGTRSATQLIVMETLLAKHMTCGENALSELRDEVFSGTQDLTIGVVENVFRRAKHSLGGLLAPIEDYNVASYGTAQSVRESE